MICSDLPKQPPPGFLNWPLRFSSNCAIDCSSTPAAPWFALTCLYASHTSRFAIQNGLALSTWVLPVTVAHATKPNDAAPSVQPHYRTFNPTTSGSAPVPRIGTLALADAVRLDFSLRIGTTGSYVPHLSLYQGRAAYMPDADWAVRRFPPILSRSRDKTPVLTSVISISTRRQRFTHVRLLDPHLTESCSAFSLNAHHGNS
jgi:hypothetical protein